MLKTATNLEDRNWFLNLVEQVHETTERLFLIACHRNFPSGTEPLYKERKYCRQQQQLEQLAVWLIPFVHALFRNEQEVNMLCVQTHHLLEIKDKII